MSSHTPRTAADTRSGGRPSAEVYGAEYFNHYTAGSIAYDRSETWLTLFNHFAERIIEQIGPRDVLDAGCAIGLLVEALRNRGVNAEGVDVSSYAVSQVPDPIRTACRVASVTEELPRRYDLIVCIEVLEHLLPEDSDRAIANFCRHTDDVLFSSTPTLYAETTHLNVQPGEYWAQRFAEHGFYRDVEFDASFLTAWAVRFRKGRDPFPRVVAGYERNFARLTQERNELRTLGHELRTELAATYARIAELEPLKSRLEHVTGLLEASQNRADPAREANASIAHLEVALAQSRATVANMERSLFWKARRLWVSFRRMFGAGG